MIKKYPLATSTWDENELNAIQKVIDSDVYSMNNCVVEFEKDFCKYMSSKYAVMVSSG
jgi:CDP-6-deoxy-D-xylo-4-hexulose-3-dehydrase